MTTIDKELSEFTTSKFAKLPESVRNQIIHLLSADHFTKAKEIYEAYLGRSSNG